MVSEALKVTDVRKKFGALAAVGGVSMTVEEGERRAVIGPNGAGKTTFFNLISGALPPTGGNIQFNGQDVTNLPDWKRVRLGLARTFQRNNLFLTLTTFENVRLAVQRQLGTSYNMFKALASHKQVNKRVEEILEAVGLTGSAQSVVANLSYGEQRQLEVALSLATEPKILLLDEPTAGMSASETNRMIELIKRMPQDLTLIIVEHDMEVVFAIANKITVLHLGMILTEGSPQEVKADPRVREVYLGEEEN